MNFSDPLGLLADCSTEGKPCKAGWILRISFSFAIAGKRGVGLDRRLTIIPFMGISGEAGVAINMSKGTVSDYANVGSAVGAGKSVSLSATVQRGTIAGSVSPGSAELHINGPATVEVPLRGDPQRPNSLSPGFGVGITAGEFTGITFPQFVRFTPPTRGSPPACSIVDAGLGAATCK